MAKRPYQTHFNFKEPKYPWDTLKIGEQFIYPKSLGSARCLCVQHNDEFFGNPEHKRFRASMIYGVVRVVRLK